MSIDVANESGAQIDEKSLVSLARYVLARLGIHPQAELSVLLIGVDAMSALHEKWTDQPGPTDVLAFPMDELRPARDDKEPLPGLLGDVVLCPAVAATQAVEHQRTMESELHLLCTHGILHLLGYDHADLDEKQEMFALQDSLLAGWELARTTAAATGTEGATASSIMSSGDRPT